MEGAFSWVEWLWLHESERLIGDRFQMVSLLKLAKVTEDGVRFLSPHDGSPMYEITGWRKDTILTGV